MNIFRHGIDNSCFIFFIFSLLAALKKKKIDKNVLNLVILCTLS
jgi:hypothetical protein